MRDDPNYKNRPENRPPGLYFALLGPYLSERAVGDCIPNDSPNELYYGWTLWQRYLSQISERSDSNQRVSDVKFNILMILLRAGADPDARAMGDYKFGGPTLRDLYEDRKVFSPSQRDVIEVAIRQWDSEKTARDNGEESSQATEC
jgi:hypothetical protein